MANNKPTGLSTVVDSAPVIESEGDIFTPLRRTMQQYSFAAARFENLLRGRRAVLETADADEKPALERQVASLERTHKYYETAACNMLGLFFGPGYAGF